MRVFPSYRLQKRYFSEIAQNLLCEIISVLKRLEIKEEKKNTDSRGKKLHGNEKEMFQEWVQRASEISTSVTHFMAVRIFRELRSTVSLVLKAQWFFGHLYNFFLWHVCVFRLSHTLALRWNVPKLILTKTIFSVFIVSKRKIDGRLCFDVLLDNSYINWYWKVHKLVCVENRFNGSRNCTNKFRHLSFSQGWEPDPYICALMRYKMTVT